MAKLDIEDHFWLEIVGVIAAMGDEDRAIGNAVRWFRFAQAKHKKGRLISEAEFKDNRFSEALFPIFAKRTPSGIQAIGAEKHFSWLEQKIEAGSAGGKKSAQRPRNSKGQLLPRNESEPSGPQAQPKLSQPSSSYSSSLSLSPENTVFSEIEKSLERAWDLYRNKLNKQSGLDRFRKQVKTPVEAENVVTAVMNYNKHLDANPWKSPQNWDVFAGTGKKPKPWAQFVNPDPSLLVAKADQKSGLKNVPVQSYGSAEQTKELIQQQDQRMKEISGQSLEEVIGSGSAVEAMLAGKAGRAG